MRAKKKYHFNCNDIREKYKEKCKVLYKIVNGKKYKRKNDQGRIPFDWFEIPILTNTAKERIGYKTQKPLALIERIIKCSTNENDIILDCFGGGMTTAHACANLNRKFITGDVSPVAIKIGADRLYSLCPETQFEIKGLPQTIKQFNALDGHKFADLICDVMGWKSNPKKTGDGGIDGWDGNKNPVEIKNHKSSIGRPVIQKLHSAIISENKKTGVIVAWKYSKDAKEYVAELKQKHKIEIILKNAEEILAPLLIPEERSEKIKKLYEEKKVKFQRISKVA